MTISASVIAALLFAALATFVFPIVFLIVMCVKGKLPARPVVIGILAFFVSQICLRIPMLNAFAAQSWYKTFVQNLIPAAVVIAFSAGLFEESARYIGTRYLLKGRLGYRDAVAFGLGHGFCEAVLTVGLGEISNFTAAVMINGGTLAASLPAATYQQTVDAMLTITPGLVFMGVWERISTVLFHVFATVLIFQGVREHKARYYFYALAAHTVTDTASILLPTYTNAWVTEVFLCLVGLAGLFYVLKVKPRFQNPQNISSSNNA